MLDGSCDRLEGILVAHQPGRVPRACQHLLPSERRERCEHILHGIARCQHFQHRLDSDAGSAQDRPPVAYIGMDLNPLGTHRPNLTKSSTRAKLQLRDAAGDWQAIVKAEATRLCVTKADDCQLFWVWMQKNHSFKANAGQTSQFGAPPLAGVSFHSCFCSPMPVQFRQRNRLSPSNRKENWCKLARA